MHHVTLAIARYQGDYPDRWQTREDFLRNRRAHAGVDVEAEPPEARTTKSANEVGTSGEFRCSVTNAG